MNAARAQPLVCAFVIGRSDAPSVTKMDDSRRSRPRNVVNMPCIRPLCAANLSPARRATEIGRVMGGAMGPALRLDENEPSVGQLISLEDAARRRRPRHVSPGGSRRGAQRRVGHHYDRRDRATARRESAPCARHLRDTNQAGDGSGGCTGHRRLGVAAVPRDRARRARHDGQGRAVPAEACRQGRSSRSRS